MRTARGFFMLIITCLAACLSLVLLLVLLTAPTRAWTASSLPSGQNPHVPMLITHTLVVPDDYTTIQQAVNHAQPGDWVFVRSGTYIENVRVSTPIVLVGESRDNTTIDAAGGPYAASILTAGVRIAEFTFRGGDVGISVAPAPVADNIIEDCIVRDNTYGIFIQQSGFPTGTGNLIRNCRLENNDQAGVHLLESYHNRIENCTFFNSIRAIYVENSSNNIITGTVLTSTFNHYAGILIETTAPAPRATHNQIVNCTVSGHYYGIHIKNANDNIVEGCTLFDNAWNGINLYGGSTRNTIRDCYVYGDSDTGIDISGQAYGNRVERCTVTGMQTDGLYLFNTWDNVITDLYVHDVPQFGILLGELGQPTGTYSNTISNCRIENTFRGINAWYNVDHNVVENCVISNSRHQGINLEIGVNENDIKHCHISNSGICDVRLNASQGNRLWDSTADSLTVEVGSTGRVINSGVDSIQVWSGTISVEWYLTTSVTYRRSPVEGAQVQVYRNPTQTLVAEDPTNAAGWVRFILPEKIVRTGNQEERIEDYFVQAAHAGLVMSETVVLTSSRELNFELAGPGFWIYLPVILRQ
jgi:parallel beta-helix repeat protein